MILFGNKINIKSYNCSLFKQAPVKKEKETIALYVKFKGCNASCNFCEYKNNASDFDFKKYKEILLHLKENIWVNKINLTGGEPTLNQPLFKKVLKLTREIFPETYLILNTNGYNLLKLSKNKNIYPLISNISLSRHHYENEKNNEIFRCNTINSKDIDNLNNISKTWQFHVTCNLIKGYIDNKEEVYKYLDWVASINVASCSFVSLMPINEYCKDNFIDFEKLNLEGERFKLTKEWNYEDKCKCNNWAYLTNNKNGWVKVYTKNTYKPLDITTSLVFDGKNIRAGFNEKIIA